MPDTLAPQFMTGDCFLDAASARASTKMDRQIALEQEMTSAGVARYEASVVKARTSGQESGTATGTRLLMAAVDPLDKAITATLADATAGRAGRFASVFSQYLTGVDSRVAAYITARVILDKITHPIQLQGCAIAVANSIEDEVRFAAFAEADKEKYDLTERHLEGSHHLRHRKRVIVYQMNKNGIHWKEWSETKKVQLGIRLIELFVESTGLAEVAVQERGRYRVIATPATMKWLEESNARHGMLCPVYSPCIVPPKDWTTPLSGGYHSRAVRRITLVKTRSKGYIDELFNMDLSSVYSAVNALQRTAWRVNPAVLAVARTMWDSGLGLGKVLPSREGAAVPAKPVWLQAHARTDKLPDLTEVQKVEFKEWKGAAADAHTIHARSISRRLQAARILSIAERFADEDELFFPHSLDFRGRVYAVPPFLNPQGNDLAKGLLTFAHGKPIGDTTGPGWLAIHGANVYGIDKVSLDDRIAWVDDHQEAILACAADPLGETMWQDADSPWQFLAFCFEWAGYEQAGSSFVSSLPVALDGSCNGIQHFSAMLRDPVGGEAVNLVPGEKPADIYQRVADRTTAKLCLIASEGGESSDVAQAWVTYGINRKITKRPVMVVPYGGTYMSTKDYVEEAVMERGLDGLPWNKKEINKPLHFLAKQVWAAIGETVVGAREVMSWLQACSRLAVSTSLPINWPTPSGLWVQQAYKSTKLQKVKVRVFGQLVYLKIAVDGEGLDASRQVLGVPPNFVHSLDAAALVACVNYATENGIDNFCMIHDSYGTLAADTETMGVCLRHAFVDLYKTHDVLEQFRASIVAMLPPEDAEKVPQVPMKGTLDIDAVLQSDFFFA